MTDEKNFDVVIIGGGMVGSALAACLEYFFKEELQVAVLEAGDFFEAMPAVAAGINEVDARVSALGHSSYRLFNNLGAWQHLEPVANPFKTMDVWDADGTGNIQFSGREQGQPQLGFLVENRCTAAALHLELKKKPGIALFSKLRLESISKQDNGWSVHTAEGKKFNAKLLVGADGARSWLREQAGISMSSYDYHQQAIVATVKTEMPHDDCARQRFLSTGPLAFLPMNTTFDRGHISSVVWTLDEPEVDGVMSLDDRDFSVALSEAFEYRLGNVQGVSRRFNFPLVQRHAREYIREQLVLVGDAAHTVHPLAGQGVNLGFLDVATLAEELFRASGRGAELGERPALRRFERRRKADNQLMMAGFRGFKLLFGEKALPVRWARNAGMSFLNDLKPVKNHIVQQAMGMAGDIPELVK